MSLAPDRFEIHGGFLAVCRRRERQVNLRAQGGVSLVDTGTDPPAGGRFAGLVSVIGGRQVIHRIVHIHPHVLGVALRVRLREILREGRLVFAAGGQFREVGVEVRPAAVPVAEENVFPLARVQLVKGGDALGSVL